MSTEPPSRILPKGLSHETKSAQENIAHSRKVEKVGKVDEIDADERARQKKNFSDLMEEKEGIEQAREPQPPSPFEVFKSTSSADPKEENPSVFGAPASGETALPRSSYGDVEEAMIASPTYTPPPNFNVELPDPDEEEATTGALPQSESFWEEVDMPPDKPLPTSPHFKEAPSSATRFGKEQEEGLKSAKKAKEGQGKKEDKWPGAPLENKESSPFGPPGKKGLNEKGSVPPLGKKKGTSQEKKSPLPSPFEEAAKSSLSKKSQREKETAPVTARYFATEELAKTATKRPVKEKRENELLQAQQTREAEALPFRFAEPEKEEAGTKRDQGKKIVEIEAPSLSFLPQEAQPAAFAATSAATPYLHPTAMSLFFQMVGTMYVMASTPGVSRTEIVLNNPSYAQSRFFGATITLEKYATAPDSFNIRLTGNDAAVAAFRENIPSLMAGFQNSNLPFKVQRIEAEYTLERPVFRRKDQSQNNADSGDSDLGERRR